MRIPQQTAAGASFAIWIRFCGVSAGIFNPGPNVPAVIGALVAVNRKAGIASASRLDRSVGQ